MGYTLPKDPCPPPLSPQKLDRTLASNKGCMGGSLGCTYRIVFVNPSVQQQNHMASTGNSFLASQVQWSILILHEEYIDNK